MHAGWLYTVIAELQVLFYLAATVGWYLSLKGKKNWLFYVPYYFLFMNLNILLGLRYLSHNSSGAWEKATRA